MKYKMLLLLFFLSGAVFSQTALTSQYSLSTDTVTNTGTKALFSSSIKGYSKTTMVVYTATKISGTVAGTASLLGSIDGTNWYSASSTTFTNTDTASQSFAWTLTDPGSIYYKVSVTGAGTMAAEISAKIFTRKP